MESLEGIAEAHELVVGAGVYCAESVGVVEAPRTLRIARELS